MQFETQEYQEECINNIISILDKIDVRRNDYTQLSEAVKELYQEKNYNNFETSDRNRLDILMETGTGKTFVYLNAIYELNKRYKKNHFVIIVPTIAIKLGVIQQIELTDEYFFQKYKKHISFIDYSSQVSLKTILHDFIQSHELSVLIMTAQAFNKEDNRINKTDETMLGTGSVLNMIANKAPVVIMDEPHRLKGEAVTTYLEIFNNSLFLRFGATYPSEEGHKLSNVVYALDSITSFQKYLVKRIRVHTVVTEGEEGALALKSINSAGRLVEKNCEVIHERNQEFVTTRLWVGNDIGACTGLARYTGVSITKINKDKIYLDNKTEIELQKGYTLSDEESRMMIRKTIETHFEKEVVLFDKHIKTLSLFFIPSISDFRSSNPRIKIIFEEEYKKVRDIYYKKTSNKDYKQFLERDYRDGVLQVHQGYFSGDKDSNKSADIQEGVNIILKEKERLLSIDTPLRFIFSVWALQEGWDNPNVYTICKLASKIPKPATKENVQTDISRRQQIGRGLRIAVNKEGRRLTYKHCNEDENSFYDINTLDVVVSSKEQEFIVKIQEEILEASFVFEGDVLRLEDILSLGITQLEASRIFLTLVEAGVISNNEDRQEYYVQRPIREFLEQNREMLSFLSDNRFDEIKNKFVDMQRSIIENGNRAPKKVKIRKQLLEEFKELWETINKTSKIVYTHIQDEIIIDSIVEQFSQEEIDPIRVKIETKMYNAQNNQIEDQEVKDLGTATFFRNKSIKDFIDYFIQDEKLPMSFVLPLFQKIDREKIIANPSKSKQILRKLIKDSIHDTVLQQVSYQFGDSINISSLQDEDEDGGRKYLKEIEATKLGRFHTNERVPHNLLFDTIVYDSNIEKEIMQSDPSGLNIDNTAIQIRVFAKLPKIHIPTPYKKYNPDFAYLIKNDKNESLFLVVESKGYNSDNEIPHEERQKIHYAKKFFAQLQEKLPHIKIRYESRINRTELLEILQRTR